MTDFRLASTGPLWTDDYPAFLSWRQAHLAQELGIVTLGLTALDEPPEPDPAELIVSGESSVVEFKSSARWNLYTHARDERLEQKIVETVAGFMNADGGTLLIGVDDEGTPVGLDEDLKLMNKADIDRYQLWLTDLLTTELGTAAAASITIRFTKLGEDKDVCVVRAPASAVPVFVHRPSPRLTISIFVFRIPRASSALRITRRTVQGDGEHDGSTSVCTSQSGYVRASTNNDDLAASLMAGSPPHHIRFV